MCKEDNLIDFEVGKAVNNIKIKTEKFEVEGEGMSENFLLNLVRTLRGEGAVEYLGKSHVNLLVPEDSVIEDVKPKEPSKAEMKDNVSKGTPYVLDTKDGIVHSVGDKNPTLGDKFSDKAKEMYSKAGVQHQTQDTDFYHTGIKYTHEGKPKYRCGYECPKCGATGRHYIPFHVTRVTCHQCQTALQVDPATDYGLGSSDKFRDEYGNFMIADMIDMGVPLYGNE